MKKLICPYCEREIPNKEHRYKDQCKYCSIEYYELNYKKDTPNVQK